MYSLTTHAIRVSVQPTYLEDESQPEESQFVWSYRVQIKNESAEEVTLRHRYWRITDATGKVHEVRGAGVVGEQPTLKPGEVFEYTSGTPLPTPTGFMQGSYDMETANGDSIEVSVPTFSLDSPYQPMVLQ